jgi:glucose/arabinose dehydrogenase/putative cell wall-binding protein
MHPRRTARYTGLLIGLLATVLPGPAPASLQPEPSRVAGIDRFETAARVSAATFDAGVDVAYVATGLDFADALAAGPAAARRGGPVLLVARGSVPEPTADELRRLQPGRITVLGGPAAVSDSVVDQLDAYTEGPVERLAGRDRFATAAAVSAATFPAGVPVAYVATGEQFPDALSGGAAAAAAGAPVLLVWADRLPAATADELLRLQPGRIVLLGGPAAVSEAIARELAGFTEGPVERVAGPDRFATSAAASRHGFASASTVYVATGFAFPDALAGVPAAAAEAGPLLLVPRSCVPDPVWEEIRRLGADSMVILGGTGAVGEAVERLIACGRDISVVATGLQAPWDVAFTPDGRAYISERDTGRLLVREPDGSIRESQRFDVNPTGEGGLLGLAASPTFADDRLLYAYYTTDTDNRIVRFRPGEPEQPILVGIPRASNHNGGRIAFGPDGLLYAGTGDAAVPSASQDRTSLAGKVLRMTPGGHPVEGNLDAGSHIYALGFRNTQGLAWDGDGRLYATEFGPDRDDEINLVVAGGNYGWPHVTGAAGDPRFTDPVVVRQPPEASWSGAAILRGGAVPEWEGQLFAAGLRGQRLWRFTLAADGGVTGADALLVGEFGRLRHVTQAPDGSLWVLTSNRDGRGSPAADDDRILRIGPPPRR